MTNEITFSLGDYLYNRDDYDDFISKNYDGSYLDRCAHVQNIILRLQAEYGFLDELLIRSKGDEK